MEFDRDIIEQSIAKQYHILPSDQSELSYSDWAKLVSGIMDDTPLGRVVQIRMEKDAAVIKKYGRNEREIRANWLSFKMKKQSKQMDSSVDWDKQIELIQSSLKKAFG